MRGPPVLPPRPQWAAARAGANGAAAAQGPVLLCARPLISVNWMQHDFGRIHHGTAAPAQTLVISSVGAAPLVLAAVAGVGADFNVGAPGATVLPPGSTTSVAVEFRPTGLGVKQGQIQITSNASNQPAITVAVSACEFKVLTLVFEDEPDARKQDAVTLKVQQNGQPEQEADSDAGGRIAIETEVDAAFDFVSASHDDVLEFHSLESA